MTTRTEYRVVAERDGQQWVVQPPYSEATTAVGAVEALRDRWVKEADAWGFRFDRVFVVHRDVTETGWVDDQGQPWDEQAARDRMLEVANERRYG